MNSKEIVSRYIGALEDDLQHYTMVDKDKVKAKFIEFQLEEYKTIKQDLDRLDELRKNHAKLLVQTADLEKENEFLETNIKAIETSNDRLVDKFLELEKIYLELVKEYTKRDQVINILKDKIEFEDLGEMQSENVYRGYFNDCLDEEEVNSIKEVFER